MEAATYASTWGFAGVLAGSLLVAIDAVALAPSLPTIADAFHSSSIETYWVGVAYTLGCATFMPLFPAASSACGRRPVVLAAQFLFLVGTLVCASATTIGALLVGRSLQGIGGGGIVAMLYVVISDLFDMRWRPKALSINGLVWLLGVGTGPVMGGGFSANVSWRWSVLPLLMLTLVFTNVPRIFWIVLPVNAVAMILTACFLVIPTTSHPTPAISMVEEKKLVCSRGSLDLLSWRNMDYLGALLLVTSLTSFLIPIIWGGIQFSWTSYHTLLPLILGIAGLIGWIVYEGFIPANPIMPLSIVANRTVAISFIATFVTGVVQFGVVFYLPLYYQIVKGYSPLISGVALLPTSLLSAPSTTVVGIVISKTGKYKMAVLVGWAMMSLGCGLLVLLNIDTSVPAWIFISFPVGLGFGIVVTAMTVASTAPVRQEHMAIASGLSPYTRSIGQAIGVAVGNSMVQNIVKNKLSSSSSQVLQDNANLIAESIASSKILSAFMVNETDRHDLLHAYVQALQDFWWLLTALCLTCLILCVFIKDYSLDRENSAERLDSSDGLATESAKSPPSSSSLSGKDSKTSSRQWDGPDLTEWTSG